MTALIGKHTTVEAWYCAVLKDDGNKDYRVINESYAVASAVAEAINHPERWEPTEAYEIAGSVSNDPLCP